LRIIDLKPTVATEPVGTDPDDPAIWRHPRLPERSLVLGTNKTSAAEGGALYVFGLDGKIRQVFTGLDRPNNVAVSGSLAAVTERLKSRLRFFRITDTPKPLTDAGALPVFVGEKDDFAAPMGVALYRRSRDRALFVIVGRKSGPADGYLEQWRLQTTRAMVTGKLVRRFGSYSGKKEIESIAVDDATGLVYYSDEGFGVRCWSADPDARDANRERRVFAQVGWKGDHEGIALWGKYVVCTDQIPGGSLYYGFEKVNPDTPRFVIRGGADETDGIEIYDKPLSKHFPHGILVAMNSGPKNFLYYALPPVVP
jgi:3-phytase